MDNKPSISVFFPCYNEAAAIEALVEKSLKVLDKISDNYEVILVNDGSSDGTAELADVLAAKYPSVKAIHHSRNQGYGAALQSGFRAASMDLVFYTDGDSQFDMGQLPEIMPLIEDCDIVSCYRINRQDSFIRKLNAWAWGKLVCFLFKMKIRDIDCAFKLYRREIFDNISMQSTGALIDAEILARAVKAGYKITQTGVRHYPRTAGTSSGANPAVIIRAFRELLKLRKNILHTQNNSPKRKRRDNNAQFE
ncbi:MAG: glycosyltransferase family 2 protein [Anaerohalosphaera sp.]|nr:glycosyltransferase family 2 protein [Anaerohalosphaera sp.]